MPGYDRSRIVGVSEEDLEEFICGICLEVFIKPTFALCCGQTYCFDCINEWLEQNNTCPNDREALTTDQLKPSPKMVTNLLSNLRIKCDFHENGCEDVIKINDLEKHKENDCIFNPSRKCENCGLIKFNHSDKDCIERLAIKLDGLQKENDHFREKKVDFSKIELMNEELQKSVNDLQKELAQFTEEKLISQTENDSFVSELLLQNEKLQIEFDNNNSLNLTLKKNIIDLQAKIITLESNSDNLPEVKQKQDEVMDKFIGKWELIFNYNYDNYIKDKGYSYFKSLFLSPLTEKPHNSLDFRKIGDYYEIKWPHSTSKFKLGEQYEDMGEKALNILDGNKLIKRIKENGIDFTSAGEIFNDFLTIMTELNNVKNFSLYKRTN